MRDLRILDSGAGSLPAVVCLHDAGGHARRFERLSRSLERRRRVVAYDLRGHGRSPWAGDQSVSGHVDDLAAVLDVCAIEHTELVGEGAGGLVAAAFAAGHPDRVTALALLDPPLSVTAVELRRLAGVERRGATFARVDDAIEEVRARVEPLHTPPALLEEEMAEHLVAGEEGRFRLRYSRRAAAELLDSLADSRPDLRAVVCPALIVRGERSRALTEQDATAAAAELRRGSVVTVPGGHPVLWDALAETGAAVRAFLPVRTTAWP